MRGKQLFFRATTGCINCHRLEGQGKEFGPDLKGIGTKYSPSQILEQILEPSRSIHPDYLTYQIGTKDGDVVAGFLVKRTKEEVVLREGPDKIRRVPVARIEKMKPRPLSAMPVQLLRTRTAQEAADLLAYLKSLK